MSRRSPVMARKGAGFAPAGADMLPEGETLRTRPPNGVSPERARHPACGHGALQAAAVAPARREPRPPDPGTGADSARQLHTPRYFARPSAWIPGLHCTSVRPRWISPMVMSSRSSDPLRASVPVQHARNMQRWGVHDDIDPGAVLHVHMPARRPGLVARGLPVSAVSVPVASSQRLRRRSATSTPAASSTTDAGSGTEEKLTSSARLLPASPSTTYVVW